MNDWSLTILEVLNHPLFQEAEVIAGQQGLSRNVRWVHILESAENASSLNGKELILATGIDIGNNTQKLLGYLDQIVRREASGLCLRLGHFVSAIPSEAIEMADQAGFPLIVFRNPVRFVDITHDLHETIVNRHVQVLTMLDEYARSLQRLSLEGHHLSRILTHLHKFTQAQVHFISGDGHFLCVPPVGPQDQQKLSDSFQELFLCEEDKNQKYGMLELAKGTRIIYQPIIAMGQVLAYLAVCNLKHDHHDEYIGLLLDYTATALAQILLRGMINQEHTLDKEGRILEEILEGRRASEDDVREGLGLENSTNYYFLSVMLKDEMVKSSFDGDLLFPYKSLFAVFRSIASNHGFRTVFLARENRILILLISAEPIDKSRERITKTVQSFQKISSKTYGQELFHKHGISRPARDFTKIKQSFQEAEQALNLFSLQKSPFHSDLGVFRFLAEVKNPYIFESWIEDYLQPILRHDQEHGTELFHTLKTFLNANLSKKETADKLYIHRQTLYHRLAKIQELIGNCYDQPHERLCLELAFYVYEWLNCRRTSDKSVDHKRS